MSDKLLSREEVSAAIRQAGIQYKYGQDVAEQRWIDKVLAHDAALRAASAEKDRLLEQLLEAVEGLQNAIELMFRHNPDAEMPMMSALTVIDARGKAKVVVTESRALLSRLPAAPKEEPKS